MNHLDESKGDARAIAATIAGVVIVAGGVVATLHFVPGLGDEGDGRGGGVAGRRSAVACGASTARDRWGPSTGAYRKTHEYGRRGEGWFQGIGSVEPAPGGGLFVYDRRRGVVTAIDADLDSAVSFGGLGGGPGELAGLMMAGSGPRDWLAASDSMVYVYDGRALNVFTRDGRFLSQERLIPASFSPLSVAAIDAAGSRFLFAIDTARAGGGDRRLQTWSVSAGVEDAELRSLFEIRLVPVPREGGVVYHSDAQPEPLWTVRGPCVFASDGEHRWVVRYNRATGVQDTLPLPDHEVDPEAQRSDVAASRVRAGIKGLVEARTGEEPPSVALPSLEAPGVLRWTDLIVDPDGYVWVRLWREEPDGDQRPPVPIYRVDPETGEVERTSVPAFPVAFGDPGTYYAKMKDPATGAVYVARFDR